MSDRGFDKLAKALARPLNRRTMLKGVAAAALGSTVAAEAASAATFVDPRTQCYNYCEDEYKTYGDRLACYRCCQCSFGSYGGFSGASGSLQFNGSGGSFCSYYYDYCEEYLAA